jgi:LCP family protein required for cell wall assembly
MREANLHDKKTLTVRIETERQPAAVPTERKKYLSKKAFKLLIFVLVFSVTSLLVFSSQVVVSNQSSTSWFSRLPFIKQIKHLAESADRLLKGESEDRINILLLGMGGKNHEGGYLTDTIMLLSLEPSTKKVALVSIPRDLSVPVEDMGWRKINNINAFAEVAEPGSGGVAVSQALSDVLRVPIHYFLRADFQGFINIIDRLGGIEIYVENTLEDYSYPVMGREDAYPYESRFEHLRIEQGLNKMDGALALKYARSRHAAGSEGSDFARARRQQKIMEAAKDQVMSLSTLLNPKLVADIVGEFQDHISTNLKIWEMLKLWEIFKDTSRDKIVNKVLDNAASGLLYDTISEDGAYILLPKSGDFTEIQYFINNIFSDAPAELTTGVTSENATIEVRNGTWINGLASQVALDLEHLGFTVVRVGNSSHQNFQKSVIYDLTYGEKDKSLTVLKNKTGANISYGLPQWLIDEIKNDLAIEKNPVQPDFVIILGQEADKTGSGVENPEDTTD